MGTPKTWTETMERFAVILAAPAAEPEVWVRQAVAATWGVPSLHDLNRAGRALALQRTIGVLLALEDEGPMFVFTPDGGRALVARAFARRWSGVALPGPPWRLGPAETDRPDRDAYLAAANFD